MNFLNAKQLSEIWSISERRIIKLCNDGRIDGAIKNGRQWLIPENTLKPSDKRAHVSKYLETKKRILIVNIEEKVCEFLVPILQSEGYQIDGMCTNNINKSILDFYKNITLYEYNENEIMLETKLNKYYDGMIIIDLENNNSNPKIYNNILKIMAKKLYCNSVFLLVKSFDKKNILKLNSDLVDEYAFRTNTLNVILSKKKNFLIDYENISKDINSLFTGFTNSTGNTINTNGIIIDFEKNGKSKLLKTGEYYKLLNYYYSKLKKDDSIFLVSPMMESEWTETPLEMNFRLINLEAINRGVNIERIFLFKSEEIEKYKNNNTLKIFLQSNMNTLFVDYTEILEKEPELIKQVGSGITIYNMNTFICDLPDNEDYRAYISINEKELEKNYKIYCKLKQYSVQLKEILK